MRLDIRLPLGLLFVVFGILLSGFGLVSDKDLYQRSLHVNINLWWGIVMLAFGMGMLALGRRSHRRLPTSEPGAESQMKSTSAQE
jgi:multisubunit Na+/H+ antiporter MnhG subunit